MTRRTAGLDFKLSQTVRGAFQHWTRLTWGSYRPLIPNKNTSNFSHPNLYFEALLSCGFPYDLCVSGLLMVWSLPTWLSQQERSVMGAEPESTFTGISNDSITVFLLFHVMASKISLVIASANRVYKLSVHAGWYETTMQANAFIGTGVPVNLLRYCNNNRGKYFYSTIHA